MGFAETVRVLPHRTMRSLFISLSHRRSLARLAVRSSADAAGGRALRRRRDARRGAARHRRPAARRPADHRRRAGRIGHVARAGRRRGRALPRDRSPRSSAQGLDVNVSLKLTQMGLEIDRDLCRANVMRIVEAAAGADGFVRFDMEDHTKTDATLEIWRAAHERYPQRGRRHPDRPCGGAPRTSTRSPPRAAASGSARAPTTSRRSVAYRTKRAVDANYARLMERLLLADAHPALATHDPRLIARAIADRRARGDRPATGSSSRCSTASGATCSARSSIAATRSASTSRTARSGTRTSCAAWPSDRPTSASCCGPSSQEEMRRLRPVARGAARRGRRAGRARPSPAARHGSHRLPVASGRARPAGAGPS